MKKAVWISYDFGLKGDYAGLYRWLDNQNAVDCGQGLAFLKYEAQSSITSKELMENIFNDLSSSLNLSKSDRIYIVCKDGISKKVKGEFLHGTRKAAPWKGYGDLKDNNVEDEGE